MLLSKVDVRLLSLSLNSTFSCEEPNWITLAKNDKIPSTALTSIVPFVLMPSDSLILRFGPFGERDDQRKEIK